MSICFGRQPGHTECVWCTCVCGEAKLPTVPVCGFCQRGALLGPPRLNFTLICMLCARPSVRTGRCTACGGNVVAEVA